LGVRANLCRENLDKKWLDNKDHNLSGVQFFALVIWAVSECYLEARDRG